MHEKDIQPLLEKYKNGSCTDEELALIESWYLQHETEQTPAFTEEQRQQQALDIWAALPLQRQAKQRALWPRLAAAAAVLIISLGVGFYFLRTTASKNQTVAIIKSPVVPGSNKAVLTLASGQKINLTDAGNGKLTQQAGSSINKISGGQIAYQPASINPSVTAYNTIETPRGGQYQVVLPDGTRVWLNSASSIRFPASFAGMHERRVTLTGEAYFEVVHHEDAPFVVSARGQEIRDIGTHFNVMSYEDEGSVKTTLLEGAVKLTENGSSCLLQQPGQLGQIETGATKLTISQADVMQITAWKNGLFIFKNTDLHGLMRQLSRWYDVDIAYAPGVDNDVFFGKIERRADLAKVLEILEAGGVHFTLTGHKLTVIK